MRLVKLFLRDDIYESILKIAANAKLTVPAYIIRLLENEVARAKQKEYKPEPPSIESGRKCSNCAFLERVYDERGKVVGYFCSKRNTAVYKPDAFVCQYYKYKGSKV